VVTDGECILSLAWGIQAGENRVIAEGRILLYTRCVGMAPILCLLECESGRGQEQLGAGGSWRALVVRSCSASGSRTRRMMRCREKFMTKQQWHPRCLVYFEDTGNANAVRILYEYILKVPPRSHVQQGLNVSQHAGTLGVRRPRQPS